MCSALLEPGFAIQTRRTSLGQPKYIFVVWCGYVSRRSAWRRSARIKPFLDLRMAIHKRNTARAIMIAGRKIHHVSRGQSGGHHNSKPSIVDAVRVLVDENKTHRGSRIYHVRILFVGAKRRRWKPSTRALAKAAPRNGSSPAPSVILPQRGSRAMSNIGANVQRSPEA